MKNLCCIALKMALLLGCFSPFLIACDDNDSEGPSKLEPIAFSEKYFDKLSTPLTDELVYSKAVYLKRNSVIQSIDVANDGTIYYVQIAGTDQHQLNVLRGVPNETKPTDCMVLEYFGHGTNMAIEETNGETYIWMGSHGGAQTIWRVK